MDTSDEVKDTIVKIEVKGKVLNEMCDLKEESDSASYFKIHLTRRSSEMTEENSLKIRERGKLSQSKHRANLTEEQLAEIRERDKLRKRQSRANQTNEQLNRERERNKLLKRKIRAKMTDGKLGLTGKEEVATEKLRGEVVKLPSQPISAEERRQRNYFYHCAWEASFTREEREERRIKLNERQKEKRRNHTPEERQRYLDCLKRSNDKRLKRLKEGDGQEYRKYTKRIAEYYRNRLATEGQEKRWKRLQKYKVDQAVTRLKKQMRKEGLSEEEIQVCADALKAEMATKCDPMPAPGVISEYKPRPRKNAMVAATTTNTKRTRNVSMEQDVQLSRSTGVEDSYETTEQKEKSQELSQVKSAEEEFEVDDDNFFVPACSPENASVSSFPQFNDNSDGHPIKGDEDEVLAHQPAYLSPPSSNGLSLTPPPPPPPNKNMVDYKDFIKNTEISKTATNKAEESSSSSDFIASGPLGNVKCPKCQECMRSYNQFLEHYKIRHGRDNLKCQAVRGKSPTATGKCISMETFSELELVHEHEQKTLLTAPKVAAHTPSKSRARLKPEFLCLKCPVQTTGRTGGKLFETSDALRSHVKITHPKYFWPCSLCKLLKYHKSSLDKHVEMCEKYFIKKGNKKSDFK